MCVLVVMPLFSLAKKLSIIIKAKIIHARDYLLQNKTGLVSPLNIIQLPQLVDRNQELLSVLENM